MTNEYIINQGTDSLKQEPVRIIIPGANESDTLDVNVLLTTTSPEAKNKDVSFEPDPIAIVALALSIVIGYYQVLNRRRSLKDNRVLKASEYFTGRSQNRSAGLSLVEGLVSGRHYRDVLIPLLYYQYHYLMIAAKPLKKNGEPQSSRPHEVKNLARIIDLLESILSDKKLRDKYKKKGKYWVGWVLNNIQKRIELLDVSNPKKEIFGVKRSYLEIDRGSLIDWSQRFERLNDFGTVNLQLVIREENQKYYFELFNTVNDEWLIKSKTFIYSNCEKQVKLLTESIESRGVSSSQSEKGLHYFYFDGEGKKSFQSKKFGTLEACQKYMDVLKNNPPSLAVKNPYKTREST